MEYWLTHDDDGKLNGYATYKQFEGQICVDKLPECLENKRKKLEDKLESDFFLKQTNKEILRYLEEMAAGEATTLTEQEFKDLCLKRKNARIKLRS
jgi:hypothetical protein